MRFMKMECLCGEKVARFPVSDFPIKVECKSCGEEYIPMPAYQSSKTFRVPFVYVEPEEKRNDD